MTPAEREEWADRRVRDFIVKIDSEYRAGQAAVKAAKEAANWAAARDLDAHIPCRVQVVTHETDEHWEAERYLTDCGRIGWVRTPSQTTSIAGTPLACTYIEDMDPEDGIDDGNPDRYHEPRHIRRLPE